MAKKLSTFTTFDKTLILRMRIITTVLFSILSTINLVYSQSLAQDTLDPYGFVNKYDTKFNGIGPKVYILPLPRTLKDEMIDTYKEIQTFQDSIHLGYHKERLISTFKRTSNNQFVHNIIQDKISESDQTKLLQKFIEQKNHAVVYGLYNIIANDYLLEGKIYKALEALNTALSHAQSANNPQDIATIQSNLASTYLLTNKFDEALHLESLHLENALKTKNIADQAVSTAKIAWIQAYKKEYHTAENTIIRKAIPLFNKSKYYAGKVDAWIILADIYRAQNKHTEAQWFLLQARDLAKEKDFSEKLATIEYMLGSSKMIQSNYKVAQNELEEAWNLVKGEEDNFLQLAIAEQLGRSHVHLKDYESAKNFLDQYWSLRKSLFSKKITSIQ
ncbi:tetratricopeptide repeat protein [Sphingobacterium composti Ten et al. 2007 non Yoo et al. 2007]|uniref:tetratricopeptide repeat protein n=1 Tax=Sphingobacterium composti TaxID=363260 RepID=UPI00135B0B89|nr:tetratricopeptide repeat protein [Sphingobacterium composti Ten et al. 2007 non Yoo et al. 2007]